MSYVVYSELYSIKARRQVLYIVNYTALKSHGMFPAYLFCPHTDRTLCDSAFAQAFPESKDNCRDHWCLANRKDCVTKTFYDLAKPLCSQSTNKGVN